MRAIYIMALTFAVLLVSTPALAELTDYQRGVAEGLNTGFYMGKLFGMAQYSEASGQEYNAQLDQYNQWLTGIFGANQSLLDQLAMPPLIYQAPVAVRAPA
ncbi:MAG: hypothetical protein GKC10_02185 [Methanosarcinales archaeon]|nr:hypothetical protein [Methanosarcinales archaeon]